MGMTNINFIFDQLHPLVRESVGEAKKDKI